MKNWKSLQTVAMVCMGTAAAWSLVYLLHRRKKRLPPLNKESMVATVTSLTSKQAVDFLYDKVLEIGLIFRLNLPELVPVILISDPKLVRIIYEKFDEKTHITRRVDGITGYIPNVFSKPTYGAGWEGARKSLSKSFSNSNLVQSLPLFYEKLHLLDTKLKEMAVTNKLVDINHYCIRLTLDFLTNAMFDTDFNFLNGGNDQGRKLLDNLELVLLEYGMKAIINPFRPYMIWDSKVLRARTAAKMLLQSMQSILDAYRNSRTPEQIEADQSDIPLILSSHSKHFRYPGLPSEESLPI